MDNLENVLGKITKEEAIRRIEQVYHAGYDTDSTSFDVYDQLLACEAIAEAEQEYQNKYGRTNENVSVKWSVNDIYKRRVTPTLTKSKHKAVAELGTLNYKTPPIKISQLLEILFAEYNSKDGHWLYIAQNWNPRAINRVIKRMIGLHNSGRITIKNPAAYFTHLIKFRKRRKVNSYQ